MNTTLCGHEIINGEESFRLLEHYINAFSVKDWNDFLDKLSQLFAQWMKSAVSHRLDGLPFVARLCVKGIEIRVSVMIDHEDWHKGLRLQFEENGKVLLGMDDGNIFYDRERK